MCGIVGYYSTNTSTSTKQTVMPKLLQAMKYRGPDDTRIVHFDEIVSFGHNRLAVIDVENSLQPMVSSCKRYIIVFNGEIYNYLELKKELCSKYNSFFVTDGDTEVLLKGFIVWGENVVNKIDGMYSFCIYDKERNELFGARDPYGQKPFYYTVQNNSFVFSSELRSFKNISNVSTTIDPKALLEFSMFEAFYFDATIFREVHKLPGGHCFNYSKKKGFRKRRFYENLPVARSDLRELDAIEALDHLLLDSLKKTVRADVPIATLLSGGLDSSLIVSMLRKIFPFDQINTFSISVKDKSYDESYYSRQVAELCSTEHMEFALEYGDIAKIAHKLPALLDEPQADPGILPKYFICNKVAKDHKVALGGDGADEFFLGYIIFKAQKISRYYRRLPAVWHNLARKTFSLKKASVGYMRKDFLLRRFFEGFPGSDYLRNYAWTKSFSAKEVLYLFKPLIEDETIQLDTIKGFSFIKSLHDQSIDAQYVSKLAYKYQNTFLPDYILCNSDRSSMLNSLELRTPYLNRKVVEFANSLPDSFKLRNFTTKNILKKVAERYLPEKIIYRNKVGFTVPIDEIIRTSLKEEIQDIFSQDFLRRQNIFDFNHIKKLLERHNRYHSNEAKKIWTLYSLQKWLMKNG